ncbi:hypothetical protein ACQPZX_28420 [Actinoplanes sp. CA-142083]|uniref:hypothetical protein n=1 Tax=Actinoplanes sp. CA-142083 TaxID=3239903 RepID=UPI003D8F1B5D
MSMLKSWAVVVGGAAVALLLAWLGRLAGLPVSALLAVGGGVAALMWTVVLVTLPWNLYFDARQVLRRNEVARERGVNVPEGSDREARLIARRTLILALAGHLGTALVTAAFAAVTGSLIGYYLSAFYLISTAVRPAQAFLAHLRERIGILRRDGAFPYEDVAALRGRVHQLGSEFGVLRETFGEARAAASAELHRVGKALADDLAQLRVQLGRLESAQATDRADYRALNERTRNRIDEMSRRIESTLDGIGDHQALLTGARALVRTEPA